MMRRLTLFLLALMIAVALGSQPFIVRAHADYERSEPAAGAVIAEAPEQLRVWFNQELFRREGANVLEVFGSDGERVDLGDVAIDDDDRTLMTVSLPPDLPDGVYRVHWHTLSSEDGHEGDGEFTFTVGEATAAAEADSETTDHAAHQAAEATATAVPATPTPLPAPTATPAPAAAGGLPCMGSSAIVFFALGAVFAGRRRQR